MVCEEERKEIRFFEYLERKADVRGVFWDGEAGFVGAAVVGGETGEEAAAEEEGFAEVVAGFDGDAESGRRASDGGGADHRAKAAGGALIAEESGEAVRIGGARRSEGKRGALASEEAERRSEKDSKNPQKSHEEEASLSHKKSL